MTVNNRIQIKTNLGESKVTIPLGTTFDETGREDQVRLWEMVEQQDAVNLIRDYETTRYYYGNDTNDYKIYYGFHFTEDGVTWDTDYKLAGFTHPEMFRGKKSFTRSFFKFDFYDTPVRVEQQLMFSMIMPVTNSDNKLVSIDYEEDPLEYYSQLSQGVPSADIFYEVSTPLTTLAPSKGNNEGYYIQWYKNKDLYDGDTFYMSCKFYNSKTGEDVRMVNKKPNAANLGDKPLEPMEWYYYAVKLYVGVGGVVPKYYYKVYNSNNITYTDGNLGSEKGGGPLGSRIKFYQYFN